MSFPLNILEEELKMKVATAYFGAYDTTRILEKIDFCVAISQEVNLFEPQSLLWAEAKAGNKKDIYESFVQLILTIGKAKTFNQYAPPPFLGAFDAEKMAFLPYLKIRDIFYQNDFNWNVAPSDHSTKEFLKLYELVKNTLEENAFLFYFDEEEQELHKFIRENLKEGQTETMRMQIDKNNFTFVYAKWEKEVKPSIKIRWGEAKKQGIIDADFYLADLLSKENSTIREKLFVLLKNDHYEFDKQIDDSQFFISKSANFQDNGLAHKKFWLRYERPPKEEYWDYIVDRRDLLVPQDVRERKGSFYTPQKWVELSQRYIVEVLGENWQEEYYVWDCAAGTGNLLAGLTNKYRIFASTIDKADVDVMKDRIQMMNENSSSGKGANLLESHVFQFDFLNDEFSKLPQSLQDIINDEKKRKKLIIYINPPYAEASSYGENGKPQVANRTKIFERYKKQVGAEALQELFALFLIRIYEEIPQSIMAFFSTPKFITSEKFNKYREVLRSDFIKGFVCNANSFDNVNGKFPIGFYILKSSTTNVLHSVSLDVYFSNKDFIENLGKKSYYTINKVPSIKEWRSEFYDSLNGVVGYMIIVGPSMQSNDNTFITNNPANSYLKKGMVANITKCNVCEFCIYHSIRHCIETTWLNHNDQYLYPNDGWKNDKEFQNNCLAFTLFHEQNRISCYDGTNYWIPFSEEEVNAKGSFKSRFMYDYIHGKLKEYVVGNLYKESKSQEKTLIFSPVAQKVLDCGRELWRYYHKQDGVNVNASFYDIRAYFQGFSKDKSGKLKMNSRSTDEAYNQLITNLRQALKLLAKEIEPKVYEYGFLKG